MGEIITSNQEAPLTPVANKPEELFIVQVAREFHCSYD